MYKSVPQPKHVFSAGQDTDDGDYDVLVFYPSRYRVNERAIYFENEDEDAYLSVGSSDLLPSSVESLPSLRELRRLPSTPVMSVEAEYIFLEATGDEDIKDMGYSETFTAGLWAQSRRITRRLDAFIAHAVHTFRALKNRIVRQL